MKLSNKRRCMRVAKAILTFSTAPIQVSLFLAIRILRGMLLIRFAWVITPRIGHMASNFEILLTNLELGHLHSKRKTITVWVPSSEIVANKFLFRMIKRRVFIVPRWSWIVVFYLNRFIPGGHLHDLGAGNERDYRSILDSSPPQLRFEPKELEEGKRFLKSIGIPETSKFVCLNIRDSSYLSVMYPGKDWSYHDYRDTDLRSYIDSVKYLVDQGYFVIRMGAVVGNPFPFLHPMFIDYACSELRTDFLDVFLGANCTFCVSTGTGFDSIPYIFRREILFVNHAPMRDLHLSSSRFVNLSQQVLDSSSGEFLSLKQTLEIDEADFMLIGSNKHPNLKLIQNTDVQILEAVKEVDLRLNGSWIEDEQEQLLQEQFKVIFSRTMQSLGIEIEELRMNYSSYELKNNSRLLLDI